MKKKLSRIVGIGILVLALVGCGETTMDGGRDTDGRAGETGDAGQSEAGRMVDDAENAVKDAADGIGNAGRAMMDGAENAANDVTGGVSDGMSGR